MEGILVFFAQNGRNLDRNGEPIEIEFNAWQLKLALPVPNDYVGQLTIRELSAIINIFMKIPVICNEIDLP